MKDNSTGTTITQNSTPTHFTVLPAIVRYDKNLCPNAKIIFSEIKALANTSGKCWASNGYFANLFYVDNSTVSRWINALKREGYITCEEICKSGSKELEQRIIRLTNKENQSIGGIAKTQHVLQKDQGGQCDNATGTAKRSRRVLQKRKKVLQNAQREEYNTKSIKENSINTSTKADANIEVKTIQSEQVADNKALDIVQPNIDIKPNTDNYSNNMRNPKDYKMIFRNNNYSIENIHDYYSTFTINKKEELNIYYNNLINKLSDKEYKNKPFILQLMYSLFLSKSIDFTNEIINNNSIDRMDLNIIDSLYEEYCSINNTPIVTTQSIITFNVAQCATDTSMIKDSNNSVSARASGEISAPTINVDENDHSFPFSDTNLIARTITSSKIESLKSEIKETEMEDVYFDLPV